MMMKEKPMNVKIYEIVTRLEAAALAEKNDAKSNALSRIAERVAEVGTPYAGHWDGPITADEMMIIRQFIR